ncbi:uncharacterized protein LOC110833501 isoform X2 [Zootermopsis nevadensis]|uniref:uncharacterized protein LOC110833501 isoform X2 n=1 Tax=Zootermopsis nevadensis TaxID=136037 RepID=UPI000B8E7BD4|nr:uncharacterized protein LOC110833501 isoform X2 [Zootermopsis nevadensis]
MPSKKTKYNARFPAGRIKKIMQTDEEVGKVAQAVPVIISRTLELFVESLLKKAMEITSTKNAKTLSPSHMKQCILSESRFDFLKDLVIMLPDVTTCDLEDGAGQTSISVQPSNSVGKSDTASAIQWKQEGVSVPSSREDIGHVSPSLQAAAVSSNKINLNFYKETEEASMSVTESFCQQPAAVAVTPPRSSFIHPSATDIRDTDDSGSENEERYRRPVIVPRYVQPKASATVDEDYDT